MTIVAVTPNDVMSLDSPGISGARDYHAPRWAEPLVFALHRTGQRGLLVPRDDPADSGWNDRLPEAEVQRSDAPLLPEVAQPQVLRHYLRLSQETLGADLNADIGQGTCTIKYSPKINERFARDHRSSQAHPLQPQDSVQGLLAIMHNLEQMLCEITGMHSVSLQPGAGSAAIYSNVKIVQAYHASRGESEQRNEVVTTIFSHPSNAATAKTAGYRIITLYPDASGYISLEALSGAVSEKTAALFITNPEDTGIFNPDIDKFIEAVHAAGALCVYDQANANGLLGIARAGDAGFDLGHLNLHKTFSTPHASGGPAAGAICASEALAPFLPGPRIIRSESSYTLAAAPTTAIAPARPFYGVIPNLVRAYAWIMALGADGLRDVAETAVLNNNYVMNQILKLDGVTAPFAEGQHRIEQVRYSWESLTNRTGISSAEIGRRLADFGLHYWTSHHPYVVPEPATIEPTESYSKRELDEYVAALTQTVREANDQPEVVRSAPHRSSIHAIDDTAMNDPATWATSWRAYRHKYLGEAVPEVPRWRPQEDMPLKPRPPKLSHR